MQRAVVSLIESRLIAFFVYTNSHDTSIPSQAVVMTHESRENLKEVQDHVRRRISSSMIPSIWLAVSNIPLTINGKVDQSKLRELFEVSKADHFQRIFIRPETEWEDIIHRCCLDVAQSPDLHDYQSLRTGTRFVLCHDLDCEASINQVGIPFVIVEKLIDI